MTYEPLSKTSEASAIDSIERGSDLGESSSGLRGRRVLVGVATLTLVIAVGILGISKGSSKLRNTSNHGIQSTISAASVGCDAIAPPRLTVKFSDNPAVSPSCVLPKYIEGVWDHNGETTRGGVKSVIYTKMPDTSLYMYLNPCGFGAKGPDQSACVPRWIVNDPTQLVSASWSNGIPTTIIQTETCAKPVAGSNKPVSPPLGESSWHVKCRDGHSEDVIVDLKSAVAVVEGAWSWQKCLNEPGEVIVPSDLVNKSGQPLIDHAFGSGYGQDIKNYMQVTFAKPTGFKIQARGISELMVAAMTEEFLGDVKSSTPGSETVDVTPADGNMCSWVWKWSIRGFTDSRGEWAPHMELFSTKLQALTSAPDVLPKCLPGFSKNNDPSYQECDTPDHQIPPTTLRAQEVEMRKSVR